MKKIILFVVVLTFLSCGKSNEEQMLYDYNSKNVKEMFKTNLEELKFKINSIEKIGEVKASDSINIFKNELAKCWFGEKYIQKERDTLSYDYVIKEIKKLNDTYQEIILNNIKLDEEYSNYEYTEKRNKGIEALVNVESWKNEANSYSKKPNEVLSVKYKASYSLINPVLKIKQDFDKIYYTNSKKTKFIKEEEISK